MRRTPSTLPGLLLCLPLPVLAAPGAGHPEPEAARGRAAPQALTTPGPDAARGQAPSRTATTPKSRAGVHRAAPSPAAPVKANGSGHRSRPQAAPARIDGNAAWVDPMIGTGGIGWGVGSIVPGATWPYGMVKLSPDTTTRDFAPGFAHCGGYWYPDNEIRGFTHNHLSGTGAEDQGNILVMPVIGMDERNVVEEGYRSTFSHDTEVAAPGYYAVTLEDGNIRAELTATEHVGVHRYTFPGTHEATLVIDPTAVLGGGYASDVELEILPDDQEIAGSMVNHGGLSNRYGGQEIFFSAQFRRPFERFAVFADGNLFEDQTTPPAGERMGAMVQFSTQDGAPVELAVGISYVSLEQARLNREVEATDWDFEAVRADAGAAWEEELSAVDVEGGTDAQRRIFYSALYHSMMMPTIYTDVNGLYRGFDLGVHEADGFTYYTDFSLWDTFRTLHPLITLIDPERQGEFNTSMLRMHEQSGFIDRWPQGNGATGCMVGDSPAIVFADSYLKGVRNFDVDQAYDALRGMAVPTSGRTPRENLTSYLELGFVTHQEGGRSASKTLEYAYNDGALAYFADALGESADAAMFAARSKHYRNHWNPKTQFLQGRNADGTFVTPFLPHYNAEYYAEGNAYQWGWYAPHDIKGLIELYGGARTFERRLDEFFSRSARNQDTLFPDMNYWHGNEPDLHASYLYNFVGAPSKTQAQVRWVMESKYRDTPDGLDGNDDGGTLSAWYVFSAMGFFPIAGTDVYLIGSPVFTKAVVHLAGGDFTVSAPNASDTNRYIQAATLNGKPLEQAWFRHADLKPGGRLELVMGPDPSGWAEDGAAPPSISDRW